MNFELRLEKKLRDGCYFFSKGTIGRMNFPFLSFNKFGSSRIESSVPINQIEFHCTYVSTLPRGALPSCTYLREDKINATAVRALKWQHVSRYMFILSSVTLHWLKYCEVLLYNLSRRERVRESAEEKRGRGEDEKNFED